MGGWRPCPPQPRSTSTGRIDRLPGVTMGPDPVRRGPPDARRVPRPARTGTDAGPGRRRRRRARRPPLAADGHDVTVLDPSEQMLSTGRERAAAARLRCGSSRRHRGPGGPGGVIRRGVCHFVLQYRDDTPATSPGSSGRPVGPARVRHRPEPGQPADHEAAARGSRQGARRARPRTIRTVTFDRDVRKSGTPRSRPS